MVSEADENRNVSLWTFPVQTGNTALSKTRHWKWGQSKAGIVNTSEFSLQKVKSPLCFPHREQDMTCLFLLRVLSYCLQVIATEVPKLLNILLRTFAISKVSRETLPEKRSYYPSGSRRVHACIQYMDNHVCAKEPRADFDRNATLYRSMLLL